MFKRRVIKIGPLLQEMMRELFEERYGTIQRKELFSYPLNRDPKTGRMMKANRKGE